jgi:histidinol-phosphate aminotransferase
VSRDPIADLVPAEQLAVPKYDMPSYAGVRARMDANESPYPLDEDIAHELAAVLARVTPNRYPDSEASELREQICADLGVAANQVVFGNGSQDLLMLLLATFARPRTGSRATIVYPAPTFVGYRLAAIAQGQNAVEVPLDASFELDIPALEHALSTHRPNLAFFALPNNPTGTLWRTADILGFAERHRDVVIVADEAYFEYAGETVLGSLPRHENVVILRTLSKLGMAGVRVGMLIGAPQVVHHVDKIRPPFNVGALNQAAAAWLLRNHKDRLRTRIATIVSERERLSRELSAIAEMRVFPSHANYILCRFGVAGDKRATALCNGLAERGIMVRCFDAPGLLSGCFRVTVATPDDNTLFLDTVRALLA